jgi:hypothetical protein
MNYYLKPNGAIASIDNPSKDKQQLFADHGYKACDKEGNLIGDGAIKIKVAKKAAKKSSKKEEK